MNWGHKEEHELRDFVYKCERCLTFYWITKDAEHYEPKNVMFFKETYGCSPSVFFILNQSFFRDFHKSSHVVK